MLVKELGTIPPSVDAWPILRDRSQLLGLTGGWGSLGYCRGTASYCCIIIPNPAPILMGDRRRLPHFLVGSLYTMRHEEVGVRKRGG